MNRKQIRTEKEEFHKSNYFIQTEIFVILLVNQEKLLSDSR